MNEESIFIADFKNQCIREKVMMERPQLHDFVYLNPGVRNKDGEIKYSTALKEYKLNI